MKKGGKKRKEKRKEKRNRGKPFEGVILNRVENFDDGKVVRDQANFDHETNFNSITLKVISRRVFGRARSPIEEEKVLWILIVGFITLKSKF